MDAEGAAMSVHSFVVRGSRFVVTTNHTLRTLAIIALIPLLSGHIGSPNVFFAGKAGPYDIKVVVRPPEVVPGIARVTVRAGGDVQRISIRPVFWRAGSKGAPSADETTRLGGEAGTFE